MASGNYSTIRPATVLPADIEVYYNYTPNRQTMPSTLTALISTEVIFPVTSPIANTTQAIGGLYNLKLPVASFNKKGIYTVYIKPQTLTATVVDCGVLAALPEQKGLVLSINEFNTYPSKISPNGLLGHRLEYIEDDGSLRANYFTIATSSNRCESVSQNIGNTTQKSIAYRFNDTANLLFLTVTPSSATSVKANNLPFIGKAGQTIQITNPYLDPLALEIEVTEYDIESIATAMYGDQTRDINDGVVTWYKNIEGKKFIYKQSVLGEIKDDFNISLVEFKQALDTIDSSKEWETLVGDIEEI